MNIYDIFMYAYYAMTITWLMLFIYEIIKKRYYNAIVSFILGFLFFLLAFMGEINEYLSN